MNAHLEPSWRDELKEECTKPYFTDLADFVRNEHLSTTIYPPPKKIFDAFALTPFNAVRVVLLGQDPYHGPNQAHGLCFSVQDGVKTPPSLQNVYKEIQSDTGKTPPPSGNLTHWATQGVLLLNATLSVRARQAASHQKKGWEEFTNAVIKTIAEKKEHIVFLLWGSYAQKKGMHINREKHLVLEAVHPSPLSVHRGFFGCKHFSKTNTYLKKHGLQEIAW
ncbi:MAG: uracil-DNA glycosylase [Candidatus Magasanikbacteria bacterium]|jgi:uracil-DNA glycosylase|nr:uracil-DNA glycosylase [Candidatus Magasanikbacteria bacterium]MBT5262469.1 uracil-DNA glycosylase [Candidatus Magasanikbacteria bacterium]MBT5820464.1 uracil-DNA glycosylase [Candidatus Magasanikbacteria bacterium]MBT6294432.1 uracil-DNA glycosylase [Candidatus Magasanikbacteria bacterium]